MLQPILDALDAKGREYKQDSRDHYMAQCPAHDDGRPSLSITVKPDRVLVNCLAGCSTNAIMDALGLTMSDLYPPKDEPPAKRDRTPPALKRETARYEYRDVLGNPLGSVVRYEPKDFRPHKADGTLGGFGHHLYRQPEVSDAINRGDIIYLVEGEKDADNAANRGLATTTNNGGAKAADKPDMQLLHGATVRIVIDQDRPGFERGVMLYGLLRKRANVTVWRPAGKLHDLTDHLQAGHTADDLVQISHDELMRQSTNPADLLTPLPQLLAEPIKPTTWRLENLLPTGARAILAAQYKAGKTTTITNLVRSLADGRDFLDKFRAHVDDDTHIVLVDDEMNRDQIAEWLRRQNIQSPERVTVATIRGKVSAFNLMDADVRAAWAKVFRDLKTTVIIFDCLRPVLDALGMDEHKDAGRFLVAFDALMQECGATEAIVVHHMGHHGERSRGDSRIRDWPDVEWRLIRQKDAADEDASPDAPRFFSAYGRDVEVAEGEMQYNPENGHLSYIPGGRQSAQIRFALATIIAALKMSPEPLSRNQIEEECKTGGITRKNIRDAIKIGISERVITAQQGPRNAQLHSYNPQFDPLRNDDLASSPQFAEQSGEVTQNRPSVRQVQPHPLRGGELASWPTDASEDQNRAANGMTSPRGHCSECGTPVTNGRAICPDCLERVMREGKATA